MSAEIQINHENLKEFLWKLIQHQLCINYACNTCISGISYHCRNLTNFNRRREAAIKLYIHLYGEGDLFDVLL